MNREPEHIAPVIKRITRKLKLKEWIPPEEDEQEDIFKTAQLLAARDPRWNLLSASMNGILTNAQFGAKLKRLGRKKGFPDLLLPVRSRNGSSGLFIELKRRSGGVLSESQQWWQSQLQAQHYRVEICYGAKHAIEVIKDYLK